MSETLIGFLSDPIYIRCLWLQAVLSYLFCLLMKDRACEANLCLPCPVFFTVVQRVDSVSEGIANYGGKIIAVETDLKKLGMYLGSHVEVKSCN